MSEHQAARQPVDLSLSSASKKPDSQLRLVGAEGQVLFPDDARPTDGAATIISKNKPRSPSTSVTAGEVLAGKSLRGQRLAHFELLEPLGVGGMAAVILARDTQLDRLVALKILPPEMASDVENVRRFHQEARAAAKLNHENIARVFFFGEDKDLHFIVFEYVEGDNLRTMLERRHQLPVAEAVRYILQIATGLEHASGRGVVHRDIKPSNIIITPQGQAKLVDMGLARNAETHSDQALTQSGVTLGTFDYISPEQALEPREADVRSDIYSLGCTFYHMLTGQAPVPEGTAAKKLYHHQHLAPIDPRQYNSAIPDEIAAILMRMMAKNPKERYQQPIQLVHHLAQVAQKVGAVSDLPEGLMFLNAPLPGAPRFRPIITIALATLTLGVLLMLLSMGPSSRNSVPPPPPTPVPPFVGGDKGAGPKDAPVVGSPGSTPVTEPVVASLGQLTQAVADSSKSSKPIVVGKDIDLDKGMIPWTIASGKSLTLKSEKAEKPITLKFTYRRDEQDSADQFKAGFVMDGGGTITFENIRFELNANESFANLVAMVAVHGTGSAFFRHCTFVQNVPPIIDREKKEVPFADVVLGNAESENKLQLQASFIECLWEKGNQAAVIVNGKSKIAVTSCGFGPHAALFLFRGNNLVSDLFMTRCSAFVTQGPAFRLDDSHSCKLKVHFSIFSCPDAPGDDIQLIRQTEYISGNLVAHYDGLRNVYHNLKSLWFTPEDPGKLSLDEFNKRLVRINGSTDQDSKILSDSPWADARPLSILLKQPKGAFQVTSKLRDVRTTADGNSALGIVKCVWGVMSPLAPLPSEVKPPATVQLNPNEKIIDPDATDATAGVYSSLSKALLSAETGDVLLIKHGKTSREVTLNTLNLPETKVLTLKPYSGYRPVLVLSTQEKGAAMFRLLDSTLHFENLEFALEPDSYDDKGQTVVAMLRNGLCSFKNCVITLKQGEQRRSPLSVVALLGLDGVMAMPATGTRSQPQVSFTNSLIRGEGDLVSVKSSRPFELKIDKSLAALAGSLLVVQGASKDPAGEMVIPGNVKMTRVTALLTEPCILLRAGKTDAGLVPTSAGLTPTRCEVSDCLFWAPPMGKDKPFLALEGIDVGVDMLPQYLDWKGGEKNGYVNLTRMLEIARSDDAMSLGNLDTDGWTKKIEADATFFDKNVRFNVLSQRPFSQMDFERFRPTPSSREKLAAFGANLDPDVLPRFSVSRKIETVP